LNQNFVAEEPISTPKVPRGAVTPETLGPPEEEFVLRIRYDFPTESVNPEEISPGEVDGYSL